MVNEKDKRGIHFVDHNKGLRFILYSASHSNPIECLDGENSLPVIVTKFFLPFEK